MCNCDSTSLIPFLIVPNDTENIVNANGVKTVTSAISFAVAGDLSVEIFTGETVIIPSGALLAGHIHHIQTRKIHSTGTTATGIVGYKYEH